MTKVLHLFYVAVAVVFAAAPAVSMAVEQDTAKSGAIVVTDSVSVKVTVVDIKKKERKLTLRDESGNEVVVIAGDEVRNFAQIKKGDIVEVEYHRAAATTLEKVERHHRRRPDHRRPARTGRRQAGHGGDAHEHDRCHGARRSTQRTACSPCRARRAAS